MTMLDDQQIDRLADRRAKRQVGWIFHAAIYLAVNGGLVLAAWLGQRHHVWPIFPALGWGFGLVMHGIAVFRPGAGTLRARLAERERRKLLHARERAPFA